MIPTNNNNSSSSSSSSSSLFSRINKVRSAQPLLSNWNATKFTKDCSNLLLQQLQLTKILPSTPTTTTTTDSHQSRRRGGAGGGGAAAGCLFYLKLNDIASLVAASTADCIHIWSTTTGELVHCLREHTEIITNLAWFRDIGGPEVNYFYTSSLDKTIKLWKDFKVVATYKEHNDWIRCLCISLQNQTMISGCVSAVIQGWDVQTGKVIFRLPNAHFTAAQPELNTINSLQFANLNEFVFVSGARDGVMKLWDMRCLPKPIQSIQSHANKINTISFTSNDCNLLSAGRESCIRLWDIRSLVNTSEVPNLGTKGLLNEYKQHSCTGYNVGATFFNSEQNIVTGSEDGIIYIYDTMSGKVASRLEGHSSTVHLVHSTNRDPLTLVSSSIESNSVFVWQPQIDKEASIDVKEIRALPEEEAMLSKHRGAVESVMKKHGDHILKIFHKYNFTFSSPLDWQSLINEVRNEGQSYDMINKIQEMANDFARILESSRTQPQQNHNAPVNENEMSDTESEDDL